MTKYEPKSVTLNTDGMLLCPKCGFEYTHLDSQTYVLSGGDDYIARAKVRGDVIILPGSCESGHRFRICLGQHKGHTYVWAE